MYWRKLPASTTIDYNDSDLISLLDSASLPHNITQTFRNLFTDNMYLHNKLANIEREYQRVREMERCGLNEGTLKQKDEEIVALQQRVANFKFLQKFAGKESRESDSSKYKAILSQYLKFRNATRALYSNDHFENRGVMRVASGSKDLMELTTRVFGDQKTQPLSEDACRYSVLKIQAFASAAVCQWVFNGRLQCVAMMITPLLDNYRHHMKTICKSRTATLSKRRRCGRRMKDR
jgi:hypothetical protein